MGEIDNHNSLSLAPIILFAFNRPEHTDKTLAALAQNELAGQSQLIAYVDGPRQEDDVDKIKSVIHHIQQQADKFLHVEIIQRKKNIGLAANIIGGVSAAMNDYGSAIVLEDDIVTSPKFLRYMNDALNFYKDEKSVWHIAGYNEEIGSTDENGFFFWRMMNCWGWASWSDRWAKFNKDPTYLVQNFSTQQIHRFNLDGKKDFWEQVLANHKGKTNTWAIFWYATIFQHKGLCLTPQISFVRNIGFDGSGVHWGFDQTRLTQEVNINRQGKFHPPLLIEEDKKNLVKLKKFYDKSRERSLKKALIKAKKKMRKLLVRLGIASPLER